MRRVPPVLVLALLLLLPAAARGADLGAGEKPSIVVDGAGTSHVVWNENRNGADPDVTHYCRLPRGATACDNPNPTPMPITEPYSGDIAGPKIVLVGGQLVVLTHRYPAIVRHPDGQDRSRTTYAFTSTDNGATWTGPGIVGTTEPSGAATVFGTADPRIAVISDTQTGGTRTQVIDAGNFTSTEALLGPGDNAYEGTLAPEGDALVAAFADKNGGVTVRRLPAGANADDPAQWSSQLVGGVELPRLASGPSGTFLLARSQADQSWSVRGVAGGVPGPAGALTGPGQGQPRALAQDATGRLFAATVNAGSPETIALRTALPGQPFDGGVNAGTAGSFSQLVLGAAPDGGGVLAGVKDGATVFAQAFGTGTALPPLTPPAPPLAPGEEEGCQSAGFGVTKLTPLAGCLIRSTDPKYKGSLSSSGTVDLNGLKLVPVGSAKILLNVRTRELDTTGKVKVVLRGPGIGDVVLAERELHLKLGASGGESLFKGLSLPKGPDIKGFPIDASFDVKLEADGVAIPLSLKLPPALLGISAKATLRAKTKVGAVLDSFELRAPTIPLGPVSLRDLVVAYDGGSDTWTGGAGLKLPVGTLKAVVKFADGKFVEGRFNLPLGRPGVAIVPQLFLTEVRGGLGLQPFLLTAGATFGAFYAPALDQFTAEVLGDLTFTIVGGEAQLRFDGQAKLFGIGVGKQEALLTTDGFASLKGSFDLDLELIKLSGALQGFVNAPTKAFGSTIDVRTTIAGIDISGMKGALSNNGIGACYLIDSDVPLVPDGVAVGYNWNEPLPGAVSLFFPDKCDLSRYEVPRPPGRRLVTHQVPGGTPVTGIANGNLELNGTASPDVDVVLPDGSTVTPLSQAHQDGDPRLLAIALPEAGRTVLVARGAPEGVWTLVPRAGSAPVSSVRVATPTAAPRVRGRVTGRGTRKTLRYRVSVPSGTTVRLSEQWAGGGTRALGTVAPGRRSGTVRLRFDRGPKGPRTVLAVPERAGIPGAPLTVTRYTAPARQGLRAVRRLRVRGSGATWRRTGRPASLTVLARLKSGRTVARQLPGRATRVRLGGTVARVTVTPREATGRTGRAASAKAPKPRKRKRR